MDSVLILSSKRLSQNKVLEQEECFCFLTVLQKKYSGALAMGREGDVANVYYLLDCRSRFWKAGNPGSV